MNAEATPTPTTGDDQVGTASDEKADMAATLDGVAGLVQQVPDEGGRQRGEQLEQGEGGESGQAGRDELSPAAFGDAEADEAEGGPGTESLTLGAMCASR